ncbi:MAG: HIT-like domain-containing protein [Monoraphidium minutum]|nr:MAG: HIT-like domain-containing protein [Monoraphidium minutum]
MLPRASLLHLRTRVALAPRRMAAATTLASHGSVVAAAKLQLLPCDSATECKFGPWPIHGSEVFARTRLSFAFVNLKPLVPGHVLVSPIRAAARLSDLTPDEVADVMLLAQRVAARLEPHYGAGAATVAIQDGPAAGQTVPHVHVHVLPRREGDFQANDMVYDALEAQERAMAPDHAGRPGPSAAGGGGGGAPAAGAFGEEARRNPPQGLNLDVERKPRSPKEMAAEAAELRPLFAPE